MTTPLVQSLILAPDNLPVVRDQIALIIAANSEEQQRLAQLASKDPRQWKLRVFTERTDCRSEFTSHEEGDEGNDVDTTPVVSVSVDKATYDRKRSQPTQRQQADAFFNIDFYGCGISTATTLGHDSGDELAADEVLRAYGLVRKVLMSDVCSNLGMAGIVADHWPEEFKALQLSSDDRDKPRVERVAVGQLVLRVSFNEFSPQYEAETLEIVGGIRGAVLRAETGEIYFKTNPKLGV